MINEEDLNLFHALFSLMVPVLEALGFSQTQENHEFLREVN